MKKLRRSRQLQQNKNFLGQDVSIFMEHPACILHKMK